MTSLWIKNSGAIFSHPDADGLVVSDRVITEIVAKGARPSQPCAESFDAGGCLVLPGLINTHHHFYQTLTRANRHALNKPLFPWLQALYPVWARLDENAFRLGVRLALAELALSGCTTAADHHYVFPKGLEFAMDIEVEEAQKLGIRLVLTRGSMSLSEEDGGLPPKSVVQDIDTILADSERVVRRYHDGAAGSFVNVALAPCSPFSVTSDLMAETAGLAAALGVRLHTHLAETEDENRYCQEVHGCRPLDYLENLGWINQHVWLAHGIHFNASEIRRLGDARIGIAHCPTSNMMLASGICKVGELEAAGCAVGLAVDGSASNDCSNLAQEIRQAFLLNRLAMGAEAMTHGRAIRLATEGSAAALARDDIGRIAVGKQADLALFSLDALRFSGHDDPFGAFVLSGAHSASHVLVAGNWIVKDGRILAYDTDALNLAHRSAAEGLRALNG
jgi:8-oxoguanine deaminase